MPLIRSNSSNGKRVLITGASGFIGGTLISKLQARGFHVIGTTSQLNSKNNFDYVDYQDINAVKHALMEIEPTHIVHLSGTNFKNRPESEWRFSAESDYLMNSNIFMAASKLKKKPHLIYFGSCEEYGVLSSPFSERDKCSPVTEYGRSKNKSTNLLLEIARNIGMNSIVLRPSVVYGVGQNNGMLISNLVENLLRQNIFKIRNPRQLRDFVNVNDVVRAVLMILESDSPVQEPILNIASGLSVSVEAVVQIVINSMGTSFDKYVVFEDIPNNLNNTEYYRVQNSLAFESLGWKPEVNFTEGLVQYIEWKSREMSSPSLT